MAYVAFLAPLFGTDGEPESGGLVDTYVRNTSTRTPVYTDVAGATPATNPVVANSLGQVVFYFRDDVQYSWSAKSSDGATVLWEADVVGGVVSYTYLNDGLIQQFEASATGNGSTTAYTIEDAVLSSSYQIVASIDGILQPTTAYSVANDGTDSTVTFTSAPPNGSAIYLRSMAAQGLQGARGEQDRTSLAEFATDAVPLVGDGTTTNNVAIAAAEASTVKQIGVPEGTYRTTGVATGAALTKNYHGPGQIETNDGNALPPNWRVISSLPSEGNHDYILTAGNGDAQKVQDFLGTWVTGSSTLTQPSTGYKIVYEAAGRLNHFLLTASAGWNESTTGNGGRTGYFHTITRGTQAGNGDAGGYYTSIFVSGARSAGVGGPGTPTDALSMPGGVVHGGQVVAGANDVYLNNIEQNAVSGVYRASAGIYVANAMRDNADTTNNQFWFAFTAQGQGTVAGDVAFRVGGLWKFGFDVTAATLDANQAAVQLKADQRIYLAGTAGSRYCSAVGTTYLTANSSGYMEFVYGGTSAMQVNASAIRTVAGTQGSPSFSFIGDPNTGLYNSAADTLAVSVGGTARWAFGAGFTTVLSGPVYFAQGGSAGVPTISFDTDSNSGFWRIGADNIGVTVGGSQLADWSSTGLNMATGKRINLQNSQTTVGAAGGASALPATPTGYIPVRIAGTERVIPFYAVS